MTTLRPRRTRLAEPALLALLISLAHAPSSGARPAGPAGAPTASQGPPSAAVPTAADGHEADALRDAIWDLERHLRHRLAAAERPASGTASQPPRSSARLTARLHALRRAARTFGEPAATELARKAVALRPLLAEVERVERSGVRAGAGSAWSLAGRASAAWLDADAHGGCRDARRAVDGILAADTTGAGAAGELWLRFTAAAGGYVTVDSAGSRFDTVIEVYDACPSAGGSRIAGGDDETGLQARVAFRAAAGETRWLRVGGWCGAAGSLVLEIESGGVAGFAGVVTRESTGQPLFRDVEVWNAAGSFVTSIETEFDGIYVVVGLTPGTYFATTADFFSGGGLLDELYDDLPCPGGAPSGCNPTSGTPIVVPPDDILAGIDFALGDGARVAGRVRDAATGLPLTNVGVAVFDRDGDLIGEDFSDVAGRYLVVGLSQGSIFARGGNFFGGYQRELYDDIPCQGSCDPTTGTPITVAIGTTTSGIDFDLDRLGSIAGTVAHAVGGAPVPFADLRISDDQGALVDVAFADAQGEYETGGLVAGTYFVATELFGEYLDELYDDLPCFPSCDPTTGTPVPVTLGNVTAGIDFALNRLGTLSGTVTDAVSGAPLDSFFVAVFDSSGSFVAEDFGFGGPYLVSGLTAGTYFVVADDNLYRTELYDDLPCPGGPPGGCDPTTGTPVAVQIDAGTAGIDFALTPLGSIAGTVTASDTGLPLDSFSIQVWDSAGQFVAGEFSFGGEYQIDGLESGTYFVTAQQSEHVGELYDDLPCPDGPPGGCDPTTGTPVAVSLGTTTGDIDFALDPEGSISGTVRDAPTATPIAFAEVRVFDDAGFFIANPFADGDGHYRVSGLETGSYFVVVRAAGHSAQLYDGLPCPGAFCDPTVGTPVPVTVSTETGGIDFDLPLVGSISGTVSSSLGGPLGSADVALFDADGDFHDFTVTDGAGDYFFEAEAGTWFVFAERFDYAGVLYDGIPCPGSACDPTTGTPVPVVAGGGTSGIDFVLDPARGITGVVTDSAGGPLPGVAVDFWGVSGDLVGTAVTGLGGQYLFSPSAGTYFVSTDNGLGATDELWDDVPCPLGPAHERLCDPTTGDPVVLPSSSSLATGIDFALSGVEIFADGFESGDTSAWTTTVE